MTLQRFGIINDIINNYDPLVVTIQEIHIGMAIKYFSDKFQIIVNLELNSMAQIGMCTFMLVHFSLFFSSNIFLANNNLS